MTGRNFILVLLIQLFCWAGIQAVEGTSVDLRGVDWQQVRSKMNRCTWARKIVQRMEDEVAKTSKLYKHPPLGKTGWLHEYYCDDDAQRLKFDPHKPHEHVCPACGRVYRGEPYDDVWRSIVHATIVRAAEQAAILYRITGKKTYLEYARSVLLWYAGHYNQFEVHGQHAGKGRIRDQSLDEATQLVRMALAYGDIYDGLSEDERREIANKYLLPDARFIQGQTRTIHNIPCWHNAAVGLSAFICDDEELAWKAIEGPYGLKQQIRKGVRDDGFWFEGSISYNFYTLSALQPLYLAARTQNWPLDGTEKFQRMYKAPIEFAFDNGQFPANNDGWPGQNFYNLASFYETASYLWKDEFFPKVLSSIYLHKKRNSTAALLYGPLELTPAEPLQLASTLFRQSGVAILRRGGMNAYLKFGPYGGGHDHNDRLNLILFARQKIIIPDLGTSGYGIPLNRWFRSPAAHNLLIVDGRRQANCGGYLISYNPPQVAAGVKDAYVGVDIRRELLLLDNGLKEHVTATARKEHTYDLFYHVRGRLLSCSAKMTPCGKFGLKNGYEYLQNLQKGTTDGSLNINWQLRDTPGQLAFSSSAQKSFVFYLGTCPDNPANKKMSVLILRQKGQTADWQNNLIISNKMEEK